MPLVRSELYRALCAAGVPHEIAFSATVADPQSPTPQLDDIHQMLSAVLVRLSGIETRLRAIEQRQTP